MANLRIFRDDDGPQTPPKPPTARQPFIACTMDLGRMQPKTPKNPAPRAGLTPPLTRLVDAWNQAPRSDREAFLSLLAFLSLADPPATE
jgi:hypothetical protein